MIDRTVFAHFWEEVRRERLEQNNVMTAWLHKKAVQNGWRRPLELTIRPGLKWSGKLLVRGPQRGRPSLRNGRPHVEPPSGKYLVSFDAEDQTPRVVMRHVYDRTTLTPFEIWSWTGYDLGPAFA